MSSMKSYKNMMAAMLPLALMSDMFLAENKQDLRPEDIDVKPKEKPIPKGCKEYVFHESFGTLKIIAMNERSAMKKYNKWCDKNSQVAV